MNSQDPKPTKQQAVVLVATVVVKAATSRPPAKGTS